MPWRDGGPSWSDEMQARIDKVTRLLCETITNNKKLKMSEELLIWWNAHQESDRRREEQEQRSREDAVERAKARIKAAEQEFQVALKKLETKK